MPTIIPSNHSLVLSNGKQAHELLPPHETSATTEGELGDILAPNASHYLGKGGWKRTTVWLGNLTREPGLAGSESEATKTAKGAWCLEYRCRSPKGRMLRLIDGMSCPFVLTLPTERFAVQYAPAPLGRLERPIGTLRNRVRHSDAYRTPATVTPFIFIGEGVIPYVVRQ